jgi:hypothetical protein
MRAKDAHWSEPHSTLGARMYAGHSACFRINLTSKRPLLLKGVNVVRRTLFGLNSVRVQRTWQGPVLRKDGDTSVLSVSMAK